MKTIVALTLLSFISISHAFAGDIPKDTVQYIDCRYAGQDTPDHVIVSLTDATNGTFFYTTGFADDGDSRHTGKLTLARNGDSKADKNYAQFSAKWNTTQDGTPTTVEFNFTMPKNMIFKTSNSFLAGLSTTITDASFAPLHSNDDLDCFARLYPTNLPIK